MMMKLQLCAVLLVAGCVGSAGQAYATLVGAADALDATSTHFADVRSNLQLRFNAIETELASLSSRSVAINTFPAGFFQGQFSTAANELAINNLDGAAAALDATSTHFAGVRSNLQLRFNAIETELASLSSRSVAISTFPAGFFQGQLSTAANELSLNDLVSAAAALDATSAHFAGVRSNLQLRFDSIETELASLSSRLAAISTFPAGFFQGQLSTAANELAMVAVPESSPILLWTSLMAAVGACQSIVRSRQLSARSNQ